MSRCCSAGADDTVCVSEGWGRARLTLSGSAPHMTAGPNTGSSSLVGIKGEFPSSISLSDFVLSNASKDSSVNNDDCSHDESFSCKKLCTFQITLIINLLLYHFQ